MIIATAQIPMSWTAHDNSLTLLRYMRWAHELGCKHIVFPELATMGFHRKIREIAVPEKVNLAHHRLCVEAKRLGMSLCVGSIRFTKNREKETVALFINADGTQAGAVAKMGLTPSEAPFFKAGTARPTVAWAGGLFSAFLCREADDHEEIRSQLPPNLTALFWPSYIQYDPQADRPGGKDYASAAQTLAASLKTPVIQCNWPMALNHPDIRGMGGSLILDDKGAVMGRLPMDKPGMGLVDLKAQKVTWHDEPGS